MWRGVSTLREVLQSHRHHLKYLIFVPLLVAVSLASYKIGQSSSVARKVEEEAVLIRHRREVGDSGWTKNQSTRYPGGAVYTRWGRTECLSGSKAVYSGVAGGSYFESPGGGSNYLCLPLDPVWGTYNETSPKSSKIHGSEYQNPLLGFSLGNAGLRPLHDNNVPCVVCQSETKTSILMIPARNLCYNGWQAEYNGYLMSGCSTHQGRTEFICMDGSPEADPAGYRNENGALFYQVEGVCGALPCPPYVQSRELTCVVCGK